MNTEPHSPSHPKRKPRPQRLCPCGLTILNKSRESYGVRECGGNSITHRKISDCSRDSLHHKFPSVLDIDALAGLIGQALALEVKESNCS